MSDIHPLGALHLRAGQVMIEVLEPISRLPVQERSQYDELLEQLGEANAAIVEFFEQGEVSRYRVPATDADVAELEALVKTLEDIGSEIQRRADPASATDSAES